MTQETTQPNAPDPVRASRPGGVDVAELASQIREKREARNAVSEESAPSTPSVNPESQLESVEVPQEPEAQEAQAPTPLTGEESDEQLQQLGYDRPKTQNRIRQLARERNEALEQQKAAQSQLEQAQQMLQQAALVQATQQAQPTQQQPQSQRGFEEPFPKDGTFDEQQAWERRKEMFEIAQGENVKLAQSMAQYLAPMINQQAMATRETEWDGLSGTLDSLGTSREELEPVVNAMLEQDPRRSLQGATFEAMNLIGVYDNLPSSQEPPSVSTPGAGRTQPPTSSTPPPTEADIMSALKEKMAEQAQAGRQTDSTATLAQILAMRKGN